MFTTWSRSELLLLVLAILLALNLIQVERDLRQAVAIADDMQRSVGLILDRVSGESDRVTSRLRSAQAADDQRAADEALAAVAPSLERADQGRESLHVLRAIYGEDSLRQGLLALATESRDLDELRRWSDILDGHEQNLTLMSEKASDDALVFIQAGTPDSLQRAGELAAIVSESFRSEAQPDGVTVRVVERRWTGKQPRIRCLGGSSEPDARDLQARVTAWGKEGGADLAPTIEAFEPGWAEVPFPVCVIDLPS